VPDQNLPKDPEGWGYYRRQVLKDLDAIAAEMQRLADRFDELSRTELSKIKTELALLKFQAGIWGAVAGLLGTFIVSVLSRFIWK
jgi:hypothetical protein